MTARALLPVAAVLVGPPEQRNSLDSAEQVLFLDQGDTAYKFQRFGLLLTLAAIIASGGIVMDSTVVLIGAMIVAPLAVPIMGVALALTTGIGARLRTAVIGVVVGALGCVAIGAVVGLLIPPAEDLLANPQVSSRIQPGLVDLIVALATGVVGSVAVIRKDISDALPGVAIAISLVPPMCVTGMCLTRGLYGAAFGSTTLFATNVLAMILAGVVVFSLVGYARDAAERELPGVSRRRSSLVVVVALLLVVVPLTAQTWSSLVETRTRAGAEQAADAWVAGLNATGGAWVLRDLRWLPDRLVVSLLGSGPKPDTDALITSMSSQVARPVEVEVDVSDGETIRAGTAGAG